MIAPRAISDSTRLLGRTLGVVTIGSIYASLYTSKLAKDHSGGGR